MEFTLRGLRAVLAISRERTYTAAAASLHLSQPALSRRVKEVEAAVGATLFERGRMGARLTPAGRAFLARAQGAMLTLEDACVHAREVQRGEAGPVALVVVGTLAGAPLASALRQFRAKFPKVHLTIQTGTSAESTDLVVLGKADLALRYHKAHEPGLAHELVFREELVPVCAPDHPLAAQRSVSPRELSSCTWLRFRSPMHLEHEQPLARFLAAHGLAQVPSILVDSLTAQKRLIEAGFGMGLLPRTSVHEELRTGTLKLMNVRALQASVPVYLVRRKGAPCNTALQSLQMLLADALQEERVTNRLRATPIGQRP